MRGGVGFEKENAVANDTKSATTRLSFKLYTKDACTKSKPSNAGSIWRGGDTQHR